MCAEDALLGPVPHSLDAPSPLAHPADEPYDSLQCPSCAVICKSNTGLAAHRRAKHGWIQPHQ
eukprot:1058694-Prorocentrum_lima.AAC.1